MLVTWRSQLLPTSVITGASDSSIALRLTSFSTGELARRVLPKAAMVAFTRGRERNLAKVLHLLGVRPGPSPFDEGYTQVVQSLGDFQLVFNGEGYPLLLSPRLAGLYRKGVPAPYITSLVRTACANKKSRPQRDGTQFPRYHPYSPRVAPGDALAGRHHAPVRYNG